RAHTHRSPALAGGAELAQRGVVRPADALAHGHDRAAAGTAVQRDVVHTGPHHGQAAARFGQLGYWYLLWIGLIPQRLRRAAPGEDPRGRGQAGSLVGHLDLAADRAEAGDHRVTPDLPATVGQDVGAGFGGREQNVVDGLLVHAEPAQGVTEDAAHHRDAECLALENQAELRIRHRLRSPLPTRTHEAPFKYCAALS